MDEALISNINKVVSKSDTLYHLGDFAFGDYVKYRKQIKCQKIILILGNHDKEIRKDIDKANKYFFHIYPYWLDVKIDSQELILCHYAMRTWNKSHYGKWHLYGHSHGSLPDDRNSLSFDVGVDCWRYYPISYENIKLEMASRNFIPIDHHISRDK